MANSYLHVAAICGAFVVGSVMMKPTIIVQPTAQAAPMSSYVAPVATAAVKESAKQALASVPKAKAVKAKHKHKKRKRKSSSVVAAPSVTYYLVRTMGAGCTCSL